MKKLMLLVFGAFAIASVNAQYSGTPILLSLPMDADTIEEEEPTFVWQTTLSNPENDPRLNVQLAVVKLDEDQTATEGMIENAPVFIRQNLLSNSLNYSSVDHELEPGVWYAWQVVLFYNGVQVQQSEVWKFIKVEPKPPTNPYYTLKTKEDNSVILFDGEELFFTTTEYGDFQLNATISGKKIGTRTIRMEEMKKEEGQNSSVSLQGREARYYRIDLSELELKKGTYRIDWQANNQKHFVTLVQKK